MPDLSLYQFKADLVKFQKITGQLPGAIVKKIAFDIWRKLILKTPVDTGRARAGWGLSIGQPVVTVSAKSEYPKGSTAPEPPLPDMGGINGKQTVWILNAVEYIERLEDGHSDQAPAGMVRLSLMEMELEIEFLASDDDFVGAFIDK